MKKLVFLMAICLIGITAINAQRVYNKTPENNSGSNSSNVSNPTGSKNYSSGTVITSIPKKEWKIAVAGTQQYWDIPGYPNSSARNANVQIWANDNYADRKVMFIPSGDGYFYIKFSHNGYYLDDSGGQLNKGDNVQIWQPNRSNAQKWQVVHTGNGTFKILTVNGYALDCAGGGWKNGTNLCIWDDHGGRNQTFEIRDASNYRAYIP